MFSAHRVVLAATVPYFYAMFTSQMREVQMDEIRVGSMLMRECSAIHCTLFSGWSGG